MVRDQNLQRRIEALESELEAARAEFWRVRDPGAVLPQQPRIGKTVDHDDYPDATESQEGLYGHYPVEFIDSGHSGSPGWFSLHQTERSGPQEDYSVIAAHLGTEHIEPETLVSCFQQQGIYPGAPESWFIIPLGGGGGGDRRIGVLENDLPAWQVGRVRLAAQVAELDVGDTGSLVWKSPIEWVKVLNITSDELLAGNTALSSPQSEILMSVRSVQHFVMDIVFPAQIEECDPP